MLRRIYRLLISVRVAYNPSLAAPRLDASSMFRMVVEHHEKDYTLARLPSAQGRASGKP